MGVSENSVQHPARHWHFSRDAMMPSYLEFSEVVAQVMRTLMREMMIHQYQPSFSGKLAIIILE